jgi:hypothetical protein
MDDNDLGADGPAALARYTHDAVIPGTRRIVARTVASEPLDHYGATILDAEAYEAGRRLRALMSGTWPAARCTAPASYASAASEYDEEDDEGDDDERWQRRNAAWAEVQRVRAAIGRDWAVVEAVCRGYWMARLCDATVLTRGLSAAVAFWR